MQKALNSNENSNKSDNELLFLIKNGNESAFEEIVLRHKSLISIIAQKYSAEGFEKNDFIQEGLLALHSACKSYKEDSSASFKNYAAVCIENRFITILRKSKKKNTVPQSSLVSINEIEVSDENSMNPENLYLKSSELNHALLNIENKLSNLEKKVFSLYLSGLNCQQIADNLNIHYKSVDNAMQRIKKKL